MEIHGFIFINVYLPCKDNIGDYKDVLFEIFADISNTLDVSNYKGIIFGGDLNNNLSNNSEMSCIIKNFLRMYQIEFIDIMMYNSSEIYSFSNTTRGCFSIIDYICISSTLLQSVVKYDVVNSAYNFSDHEPVEIILNMSLTTDNNVQAGAIDNNRPSITGASGLKAGRFRFDHCTSDDYYDYTRCLIEPIYNEISNVCSNIDYNRNVRELCNGYDIERWYNGLVHALLQASYETIPFTSSNVYKHWWNESLNALKQDCMKSHWAWVNSGKPRAGP
jgi:hypothetical protein